MVKIDADTPAGARAAWVLDVVSRLHAGKSVSPAEVAAHVSPELCRPVPAEKLLDWYHEQTPPAAQVAAVDTESVGPTFLVLAVSLHDGRRYRWGFDTEPDPPHRLCDQFLDGPLPKCTDRVVVGAHADVLVRDYDSHGSGGDHLLLLHGGGGYAGAWDSVVPHLAGEAGISAIDLRGHGRADPRHRYSTAGCLDDIEAAATALEVPADRLVLVGHSLGGHVGLEYGARTACRGLIALDGPASLTFEMPSEEQVTGSPEPFRSVYPDLKAQDVANLIESLVTPALFVLCHGTAWDDESIRMRRQLADHATVNSHQVHWVDADHHFALALPELTAQIITRFLTSLA